MGATTTLQGSDFNPRAPCGARLSNPEIMELISAISIHAPRVGRDHLTAWNRPQWTISIHAPRVGRDAHHTQGTHQGQHFNPRAPCGARHCVHMPDVQRQHFNPRAPCGARLHGADRLLLQQIFQSTRPVWGATDVLSISSPSTSFQSTRPVWGATDLHSIGGGVMEFQSTRPVWGATMTPRCMYMRLWISIHAPRVGRDVLCRVHLSTPCISIHAPRVGRDVATAYALH